MSQTVEPGDVLREHAPRRLHAIFDAANAGMAAIDNPDNRRFEVRPHSALAGDDARAAPYHVSHDAVRLMIASLSHIHALGCLIRDRGALHNNPPYTLARAAIETAASVVWLLSPPLRRDRILRRLALAERDIRDGSLAAESAGIAVSRSMDDRIKELRELAFKACGTRALPGSGPLKIVETAEAALGTSRLTFQPLVAWKVCSGFSQGRLWPEISLLDRETFSEDVAAGVARLRMTNDVKKVWWPIEAAHHMLKRGNELFDQRNRAWTADPPKGA